MKKKIHILFGGSGFVGRNICEKLKNNCLIIIFDNLEPRIKKKNIFFCQVDISKYDDLNRAFKKAIKKYKIKNVDYLWHLAANSDIKLGVKNLDIDFKDTFLTVVNTVKLLKIYERKINIKNFIFSSSSAVYGNHSEIFSEDTKTMPISNYGSMKLAAEAVLSSYSLLSKINILVVRFPNVVGRFMTHGLIFDLKKKILKNKYKLPVLGDGSQTKQYMTTEHLINAIFFIIKKFKKKFNIINIGPKDNGISVKKIVNIFIQENKINPKVTFEKKKYGWLGDVNKFKFSVKKIKNLGWKFSQTSEDAILEAIKNNKIYENTKD